MTAGAPLASHCETADAWATCFLAARADDTPKEMYTRMGFRAVGVTRPTC